MYRAVFLLSLLMPAFLSAKESVSFRNEVMAVLSRAGCNSGPCHGNLNGKGGFKLSLRGENPEMDYLSLTRDALGRRLNSHHPEKSLILAKATMAVPHEGGHRFRPDSLEAKLLRDWIRAGAKLDSAETIRPVELRVSPASSIVADPVDRIQLAVWAKFSDGSTRDVTQLACFEPSNLSVNVNPSGLVTSNGHGESTILVRYLDQQTVARLAFIPARPDFVWNSPPEHNYVDRHVFARLQALKLHPAELCTDSEFVRRAHLDALGILPTADEARRFLADESPNKRALLIDSLLDRPEFADFWALKWSDLLRNEEKVLDDQGVRLFHDWLRRAIVENKPLNDLAADLIRSRGSTYANPESNYYRALRDPYSRAEATAQVFLGIRMQCAKCHNHPFDRWTQSDYHRFAALFARVDYRIVENKRRDNLDNHEFVGEQIVVMKRSGELKDPVSGKNLVPKFLGQDASAFDERADRLNALAEWVRNPDNPFFARAQANRVWQHLIGRGIVDPGDDFRDTNPPSNPELLEALTRDFIEHRFDLKHLVRVIMRSRVYQLSPRPADPQRDDESLFARSIVRPLQAEQMLDAVAQVTGSSPRFTGFPAGTRAGQLPGVVAQRRRGRTSDGEKFLAVFGKPVRSLNCECERSDDTTLARAFQLITGPLVDRLLTSPRNRLGSLLTSGAGDEAMLDELYLAALARPPSDRERQRALEHLSKADHRRAALEDVVWALLNSKEFLLRR